MIGAGGSRSEAGADAAHPAVDDARTEPTLADASRAAMVERAALEPPGRPEPTLVQRIGRASDEHFRIRDPYEIAAILRTAARSSVLVSVSFGPESRDSYLSVIVGVDSAEGKFAIDAPATASQHRRLLDSPRAQLEFELHHITHRLSAPRAPAPPLPGTVPLLLPNTLLRFQRREFFRIDVPLGSPPRCRVAIPGASPSPAELAVVDISLGGIGARLPAPYAVPSIGTLLPGAMIALPDFGDIDVALEVRNVLTVPGGRARGHARIGFRFVDPSPPYLIVIQRYINLLQARFARGRA